MFFVLFATWATNTENLGMLKRKTARRIWLALLGYLSWKNFTCSRFEINFNNEIGWKILFLRYFATYYMYESLLKKTPVIVSISQVIVKSQTWHSRVTVKPYTVDMTYCESSHSYSQGMVKSYSSHRNAMVKYSNSQVLVKTLRFIVKSSPYLWFLSVRFLWHMFSILYVVYFSNSSQISF
jgi:hypothetical protein